MIVLRPDLSIFVPGLWSNETQWSFSISIILIFLQLMNYVCQFKNFLPSIWIGLNSFYPVGILDPLAFCFCRCLHTFIFLWLVISFFLSWQHSLVHFLRSKTMSYHLSHIHHVMNQFFIFLVKCYMICYLVSYLAIVYLVSFDLTFYVFPSQHWSLYMKLTCLQFSTYREI